MTPKWKPASCFLSTLFVWSLTLVPGITGILQGGTEPVFEYDLPPFGTTPFTYTISVDENETSVFASGVVDVTNADSVTLGDEGIATIQISGGKDPGKLDEALAEVPRVIVT